MAKPISTVTGTIILVFATVGIFVVILFASIYSKPGPPPQTQATPLPPEKNKSGSEEISRSQFGSKWPFTVESGTLTCLNHGSVQSILFSANPSGNVYAVNGIAQGRSLGRKIEEIWAKNPAIPGTGISIVPILDRGLSLCK